MIRRPENISSRRLKKPFSPVGIAVLTGFLAVFAGIRGALAESMRQMESNNGPAVSYQPGVPLAKIQRVLEFEEAIENLFARIEPALNFVGDPKIRARIRAIIALFRKNITNKDRFAPRGHIPLGSENGFFYQIVDRLPDRYMGFNGPHRTLDVPVDFDLSDTGLVALVVHEGSHILNDNETRKKDPKKYEIFWAKAQQGKVADWKDEMTAIASYLEALDALTRNGIENSGRRTASIGQLTWDNTLASDIKSDSRFYFDEPGSFPAYVQNVFRRWIANTLR